MGKIHLSLKILGTSERRFFEVSQDFKIYLHNIKVVCMRRYSQAPIEANRAQKLYNVLLCRNTA